MRLSTILKALTVLIVAVLVGAITVVMNIDFNRYKDLIAEKVKEATGRTLVIDGDIKLELSLSPSLAVDGVKFENAPWGSRPQMATVDKFSAQVALLPLLTKTVKVNHVLLSGVDILIERDAKGRANFEFESAAANPATAPKESAKSAPAAASDDLPIPVVWKVLIENTKLTYIDAAFGQKHILLLDKISLAGDGPREPVDMSFAMTVDGQPISGGGQLGALGALTDPAKAWPLKLDVEAGGAKVAIGGRIQDAAGVSGLDLTLAVSGQSFATLSPLAGAPIPPIGPYSISTKVRGGLRAAIELADIAKGTIDGQVRLDGSRATPAFAVMMTALKIDLGKLLTDADVTDLLEGAININVKLNGSGKGVRSLASGLDGQVKAVMGDGRVKTTALELLSAGRHRSSSK